MQYKYTLNTRGICMQLILEVSCICSIWVERKLVFMWLHKLNSCEYVMLRCYEAVYAMNNCEYGICYATMLWIVVNMIDAMLRCYDSHSFRVLDTLVHFADFGFICSSIPQQHIIDPVRKALDYYTEMERALEREKQNRAQAENVAKSKETCGGAQSSSDSQSDATPEDAPWTLVNSRSGSKSVSFPAHLLLGTNTQRISFGCCFSDKCDEINMNLILILILSLSSI